MYQGVAHPNFCEQMSFVGEREVSVEMLYQNDELRVRLVHVSVKQHNKLIKINSWNVRQTGAVVTATVPARRKNQLTQLK